MLISHILQAIADKNKLLSWSHENNFVGYDVKVEFLKLANSPKNYRFIKYHTDHVTGEKDHRVLRLPPQHHILNSIELISSPQRAKGEHFNV